jgi:hypothetical protein
MQSNFKFSDSIYIVFENFELDLHNDYDFTRLEYSVMERAVELHWKRSSGDWVKPNLPAAITLQFDEVSKFEFKPRDSNIPFTEDDCLSTVGYLSKEDWCDGIFWTEGSPEIGWMQAFEFMSGAIIALHAGKSSITLKP